MLARTAVVLLFMGVGVRGRAVDRPLGEVDNEIVHGSSEDYKNPLDESGDATPALSTAGERQGLQQSAGSDGTVVQPTADTLTLNVVGETTAKPGPLAWFLAPLAQRIQFSPQTFLQDRLDKLRETLNNTFGSVNVQQNSTAKQFPGLNGLVHISGLNDSGFYTNRLDSAGFLGGNGWFANKGGILGGPGAIFSTGSVLTDYPSAYRK